MARKEIFSMLRVISEDDKKIIEDISHVQSIFVYKDVHGIHYCNV